MLTRRSADGVSKIRFSSAIIGAMPAVSAPARTNSPQSSLNAFKIKLLKNLQKSCAQTARSKKILDLRPAADNSR